MGNQDGGDQLRAKILIEEDNLFYLIYVDGLETRILLKDLITFLRTEFVMQDEEIISMLLQIIAEPDKDDDFAMQLFDWFHLGVGIDANERVIQ